MSTIAFILVLRAFDFIEFLKNRSYFKEEQVQTDSEKVRFQTSFIKHFQSRITKQRLMFCDDQMLIGPTPKSIPWKNGLKEL